jgi:hypothetical protein
MINVVQYNVNVPLVGILSVLVTVRVSLKLREYQPRERDLLTHNQ